MGLVLRCSECRGAIKFNGQKFPDRCPYCKVAMNNGDDDVLTVPAFLTKKQHVDRVYRDMEKASEIHQERAAEMLGVPKSELSDIKITNMRDNNRPGDIAAMPVNNAVTQKMDQIKASGGSVGFVGGSAANYGLGVQGGPSPNAGAHFMTHLEGVHGKISHLPALETMQPGYMRRG